MLLNIDKKKKIVNKINKIIKNSLSIVVATIDSIDTNKINLLRKLSRNNNIYIKIIRNTLLNLSIINTQFECLKKIIKGPIIVAFSQDNPGDAARLFKSFSKENLNFKIKGASFQSRLIKYSEIDILANIPTFKEVILSFILILKELTYLRFIRVLKKIKNKKNYSDF